ncbi:MAG TPA: hypothetical protein VGD77_06285 [Gemmatimonadaceae bacterium]
MRHKGERHIPDFAHHPKPVHATGATPAARKIEQAPVKRREPVAKPQATSAKSGRRGQ